MNVFYKAAQSMTCLRSPDATSSLPSFSPSAFKPELAVADWLRRGLIREEDVKTFEPVTPDDLKLAHDADYVDGVLAGRVPNGFGNRSTALAATLPHTTGSMLAAARHALQTRQAVCSPTSGFHHASFDEAAGYCTFNGLIVTAMKLHEEGLVDRVAIVDLDMHYGDGTAELIQRHDLNWVEHHTQGRHFVDRIDIGNGGVNYFRWLNRALRSARTADLVLYQAGADPHVNDPLGGLLSEGQMARRDHMVFEALRGIPLVWNLAGGYQRDARGGIEPVLRLHRHTVTAALAVGELQEGDAHHD